MVVLLVLGSIFTLGGLGIYYLGNKRGVPNALLWGLFPILHGFHEYAEYLLDELDAPILVERFEILFAISSSVVLVVAVIEFLGTIPRPYGKLAGSFSLVFVVYFLFLMDPEALEILEHQEFGIGMLTTSFFRFFFGTVLVLFAIVVLLYSYYKLDDFENTRIRNVTLGSTLLLLVFALFEGFTSTNAVFITLRGISAVLFLLVPAYVLLTSDLGLQTLLITHEGGNYIIGYSFQNKQVLDDDRAILTGNFIAAISTFSRRDQEIGGLSEITTTQGKYIININQEYLVSLLTRDSNELLEAELLRFTEKIPELISMDGNQEVISSAPFLEIIEKHFSQYH